jgi:hypothetical protein
MEEVRRRVLHGTQHRRSRNAGVGERVGGEETSR